MGHVPAGGMQGPCLMLLFSCVADTGLKIGGIRPRSPVHQGASPLDRVTLAPTGLFRRIPLLPHQMRERFTPTKDVIVLCHLGVPQIERDAWSLTIDGLVA